MRLTLPLALLATLPLLQACGGSLDDGAQLRLVNATNNHASLDLYRDDERVIAGIVPATVSGWASLAEGSATLALTSGDAGSTLASLTTSLVRGEHHAVLAYVTGGNLKAALLDEDADAPASGQARLRVLNAAPSEVASLDVYLTSKACAALDDSDVPAFPAVTGVDGNAFASFAAGSRRVCVTAADDPADLRYEVPALALTDGQVATLVLTRSAGGVLLDGALLNQQGTLTPLANPYARVRLAADASGGATVGATVNGITLATATRSPAVGAYRLVPSGDLAVTLAIDGTSQAVSGLAAASGTDQTLLVTGSAASPGAVLLNDLNLPSTSSSKPARIRLVHGLNGSASTLSMTVDGEIVADGVGFGAASSPVNVAAAAATAALELSLAGSVLQTLADQTLADGRVYSLFVLGDAGGTVSTILRADR